MTRLATPLAAIVLALAAVLAVFALAQSLTPWGDTFFAGDRS